MRGTRAILITGKLFIKATPIGAATNLATVMTRIFIVSTIAARAKVGIKASMANTALRVGTRKAVVPTMIDETGYRSWCPTGWATLRHHRLQLSL